jgi:hypothetical protein
VSKRLVAANVKLKRAYDAPSEDDGTRILIDRLWPRGIRKGSAALWPLMQYGHWVTWATATAMICFVFTGRAPSAKTALPNASKAACSLGAKSRRWRVISGVESG